MPHDRDDHWKDNNAFVYPIDMTAYRCTVTDICGWLQSQPISSGICPSKGTCIAA